jgi:hypothetical protein
MTLHQLALVGKRGQCHDGWDFWWPRLFAPQSYREKLREIGLSRTMPYLAKATTPGCEAGLLIPPLDPSSGERKGIA